MNIGAIVLYKILQEPEQGLETWAKLKLSYFNSEFTSIYTAISRYYNKHSSLPSFNDLVLSTRNETLKTNLVALQSTEIPEDVSLEAAITALKDEFTQTETLKKLDLFIDNLTLLDTEEVKQELANILLYLEEKTYTSEKICLMSDLPLLADEELSATQIPLGFNNTFDAEVRATTSELIMIGGHRGSGKSVVSTNIFVDQYLNGNVGLYFSIEMQSREVFNRTLSIMTGVAHDKIKKGTFSEYDLDRIAKVRSEMFIDGNQAYEEYQQHRDYKQFEHLLLREFRLKQDNQLIIVDNQRLTLADIDLNIQKFKTQFGEKLTTVIVDYVNQIEIDDIYSWKQQIMLSKQLKNFARKYDVVMVTPYQIDKEGEARFAKGLLDAADIAMTLEANDDYISFKSTKTRSSKPFVVNSGIDWSTLRINPAETVIHEDEPEQKAQAPEKSKEELPW